MYINPPEKDCLGPSLLSDFDLPVGPASNGLHFTELNQIVVVVYPI